MSVSIDFLANTAQFLRGTKDAEGALTDVSSSLDDVARDSQRTASKVGDGFVDAGRDVDRSNERLERSFKDLADVSKRETKDAGDSIGKSYKQGADDANEGVREIGRESASTAKESAASFDGSAASIGDAFQEIAANAFAGFGPAGLLAGVAAAAGIGIVFSAIDEGAKRTEAFKEDVHELGDEFVSTGGIGERTLQSVVDKLAQMATETDTTKVSLKQLNDLAKTTGSSYDDLAAAFSGSGGDLRKTYLDAKDALSELRKEELTSTDRGTSAMGDRVKAQEKLVELLGNTLAVSKEATEADKLYAAAGGPELERKAALIEAVDRAYDQAAGAAADYVDKETGLFDVGAYVTAMQAREQALNDYQTTLETSALSPEAKTFLNSQGTEAAATFLAGYKAATPQQQAELNRIWTEGGKTSSGAFTSSLNAGIPQTLPGRTVPVVAAFDASAIDRGIRNSRTIQVNVEGLARNGMRVF